MWGPVMDALLQHMAGLAPDEVPLIAMAGHGGLVDTPLLGPARAGASAVQTPVMRYGEQESARAANFQPPSAHEQLWEQLTRQGLDDDHGEWLRRDEQRHGRRGFVFGGGVIVGDDSDDETAPGDVATRAPRQRFLETPPPEETLDPDDGFMLPPPALPLGEDPLLALLRPAAMATVELAETDEGPVALEIDESTWLEADDTGAELTLSGVGRSPVQASDADSTPDVPWTAPHTRRGQTVTCVPDSPPQLLLPPSEVDALLEAGQESESPANIMGLAAAEAECLARRPQRDEVAKEAEMRLNRELVSFVLERWAVTVAAAAALRRDAEARKVAATPVPAELRLVPATTAKRLTTVGQAAAARPGIARALRIITCQAVRVGRRRVAVQRVPRATAVVAGRRCAPCGGAPGACRR